MTMMDEICLNCGLTYGDHFDSDCPNGQSQFESERENVDVINQPSHYTFGKYEVIDILEDWFPTDPLLWQVGKYISRARHKGSELEDLKKARFYLDRRIKNMENVTKW
jgi:hypothetical protein